MSDTPLLGLPLIVAEQAQKHVTHNEALTALDAIVQLSVKDRDLATPPISPAEGERYIAAPGATGAWAGHDGKIAAWQDGAWAVYPPQEGWLAWVEDESAIVIRAAGGWVDLGAALAALQDLAMLGVDTTADATNKLAVRSNAILFTALYAASSGNGDIQFKVNKELESDTASLLFQTNFSGRAEVGLTGDDDFHFKVSPDGSAWHEAIVVDKESGEVRLPNTSMGVDTKTANYTLVLADNGKVIEMDVAAANDLTIPQNASVAFPVGAYVNVTQMGAGQTTLVADANVTLRSRNGLKLAGQHAVATLYKRGTDEWVVGGDLTA